MDIKIFYSAGKAHLRRHSELQDVTIYELITSRQRECVGVDKTVDLTAGSHGEAVYLCQIFHFDAFVEPSIDLTDSICIEGLDLDNFRGLDAPWIRDAC